MPDQELMDNIAGLQQKLAGLEATKENLTRAKVLEEQIEKNRTALESSEIALKDVKEKIKVKLSEKSQAIGDALVQMQEKMDEALPEIGEAVIHIEEDGTFVMGILKKGDSFMVPYRSLSGGERVAFDAALAYAMGADTIIIEGAEMDGETISSALEQYAKLPAQIIVNTCHVPTRIMPDDGWKTVYMDDGVDRGETEL